MSTIVADLNRVARFLAFREVTSITPTQLARHWGVGRADVLILVGSSVLQTAETVAAGWNSGAADRLLVTGGVGHSTEDLRQKVLSDPRTGHLIVTDRSEADIFTDILAERYGLKRDVILLGRTSTNCGANAAESRRLLRQHGLNPRRIAVVQDPLLQRRTMAAFAHVWRSEPATTFASCPPFVPVVEERSEQLMFSEPRSPAWEMSRFLSLLMGEIPRLRDDENGYGPRGRGFIAHVDLPSDVAAAHARLQQQVGGFTRAMP